MDDLIEIKLEDFLQLFIEKANILLLTLIISIIASFYYFLFSTKTFQSTTTIEIPRQLASITNDLVANQETINSLEGQIRLYDSNNVIQLAIQKYNKARNVQINLSISELKSSLNISRNRQNQEIVDISFQSTDPKFSKDFLLFMNESYAEIRMTYLRKDLTEAIFFLDQEIPKLSNQMAEVEYELSEKIKKIGSSELKTEQSKVRFLESINDQINVIRLRELEIKEFYKEDHPLYQTLLLQKKLLEDEKIKIQANIDNLTNDQLQVASLRAQIDIFEQTIADLREKRINYSIEATSALDNLRVNIQPTEGSVVSPTLVVFTYPFVLVFQVFVLLMLFKIIKRPISDEDYLRKCIPKDSFIGSIADHSHDFEMNNHIHEELMKKAAYTIKERLQNHKTLSVISSRGDVGKTFVCVELFTRLNAQGSKVCVIDADFRKKTLTKSLLPNIQCPENLEECKSNKQNYMIGNSIVIPAFKHDNPVQILESKNFSEFFEELKKEFDFIIIDTPPWSLFVDAEIVSKLSSATLYIARSNETTENDVMSFLKKNNYDKPIYFLLNFLRLYKKIMNYKVGYPKYSYNYYSYGSYYAKPKISRKSRFFAIIPPPFKKFFDKWLKNKNV